MKVWLKRLFLLIAVILLAAQFYRPSKLNPPVDPRQEIAASVNIHPEVAEIFERSCNDCHSNQTIWPWYSHVAPVSWLIANDVQEGRKELNFSEWASYGPEKSDKLLNKLCKETSRGAMPQFPYSLLHPKAKLTDADVQALCNWTKTIRKSAPTVAEEMSEREED
jgi:hypothetical protein